MAVNMNNQIQDGFYRYKIPIIETRLMGKGPGRRTALLNVEKIAKALDRPVSYLLKFVCYEIGTHFRIDKHDNNYIINGAHEPRIIQNLIFDFIEKYILCRHCGNPETTYKIKVNKKLIKCNCSACGGIFEICSTDKLGNFIIKNHIKLR